MDDRASGRVQPVVPTTTPNDPPVAHLVAVADTRWPRRVCWLTLATIHTTAIAFFAVSTVVYTQLTAGAFGGSTLVFTLVLPLASLRRIGYVCATFGALHVTLLVRMLVATTARRRLSFRRERSDVASSHSTPRTRRIATRFTTLATVERRVSVVIQQRTARPVAAVVGFGAWIGVDGPYFDYFFVAREAVQIALQTILVAKISNLITTPWLLDATVTVLIANCWSVHVVRVLLGRVNDSNANFQRRRRLFALLLDSSLDAALAFLVPLVVVVPYVATYGGVWHRFPEELWTNDIWIMKVTAEIQLLFATSWWDALTQFLFALIILVSSKALQDLCHREFDESETIRARRMTDKGDSTPSKRRGRLASFRWWLHTVLLVWGFVVVGLHTYASLRPHLQGCVLPLRPWFTSQTSCAVIDFNCHERGITGQLEDVYDVLDRSSPKAAIYVLFQHCRSLEMPTNLQNFSNLLAVKLYNVSLTSWAAEAALRSDSHPSLLQLTMIRVVFPNEGDGLPEGLTDADFPHTVTEINFCVTNLQRLPSDLDTKWPHGGTLLLEHCRFDHFPDTITRMDVGFLSLNGNRIRSVAIEKMLLPDRKLAIMGLGAGNPIEDLGHNVSHIDKPPGFFWLILDFSNLTTLPPWMRDDPLVMTRMWVILSGSPVCGEVMAFNARPPDTTGAFHWQQFVDCRDYSKHGMEGTFVRLRAEDTRRGLDPSRIADTSTI